MNLRRGLGVLPSPTPGTSGTDLSGVSCVAANACMAVGAFGNSTGGGGTLAESWDGARWSVVPSPNPGVTSRVLNGVSCASETTCTAAGDYYSHSRAAFRTLIETGTASA